MKCDPNEPAFPCGPDVTAADEGLTKRELFAAMAMQGLLTSGRMNNRTAKDAVRFADDLIEQLGKVVQQ